MPTCLVLQKELSDKTKTFPLQDIIFSVVWRERFFLYPLKTKTLLLLFGIAMAYVNVAASPYHLSIIASI